MNLKLLCEQSVNACAHRLFCDIDALDYAKNDGAKVQILLESVGVYFTNSYGPSTVDV